jgi:4-carboxymuconolactone decarboxylase
MYLPKKYQDFASAYPEIFNVYKELGTKIRTSGPLDEKTQNLVKLGIAVGANSRGAVMSHTRKAIASGATNEEINHAILLAMSTTGFPNMIASFHWAGEVLEKKGE